MRKVNCFLCMDKGFVLVRQGIYEMYTHCSCVAGNDHRYDERPTGGKWYVPCVTALLDQKAIEDLCVKNAKRYATWAKVDTTQRVILPNFAGIPSGDHD